jgi:hypothetical protein
MAAQELAFNVRPLRRSLQAARRWLWLQKGLRAVARSVCASLGLIAIAALLALFGAPETVRGWFWLAAACFPLAGIGAAILSRPSESQAARLVDVQLDLRQQLGTAQELLSTGEGGILAHWQIARASEVAGDLPMSRAFPLLPRRETLGILLMAATAAGLMALASLGVTIPNPLASLHLPGVPAPAPRVSNGPLFTDQPGGTVKTRSPALDTTRQMLDEIQKQAQRGALSRQAAANAIQQANAELNRAAQESSTQQQALDNLSANLHSTAAGSDVAQSLRQGDYQQAAQQLQDLGQQADQLSPAARQQLAQALNDSAAQSQANQQLARAENRAAQAMQNPDSGSTNRSMDQLGRAVEDAGSQVIPQNELADTWQQLSNLNNQLAAQGQSAAQAPSSPQAAQGPDGTGQRSTQLQQGLGSGNGQSADSSQSSATGDGLGQMSNAGGQPGNTRGGPPLGDANPRLGPDGKPLDVSGKVAGGFTGQPDAGSTPPSVMRQGDVNSTGSDQSSGAASTPAENVLVPNDLRSVVRDYFSGGTGSP